MRVVGLPRGNFLDGEQAGLRVGASKPGGERLIRSLPAACTACPAIHTLLFVGTRKSLSGADEWENG